MTNFAKALFRLCADLIARAIASLQMWKSLFNLRVAPLELIIAGVIYRWAVITMIGLIGLTKPEPSAVTQELLGRLSGLILVDLAPFRPPDSSG